MKVPARVRAGAKTLGTAQEVQFLIADEIDKAMQEVQATVPEGVQHDEAA